MDLTHYFSRSLETNKDKRKFFWDIKLLNINKFKYFITYDIVRKEPKRDVILKLYIIMHVQYKFKA